MKIKYVWRDRPGVEMIFDTVVAFAAMPSFFTEGKTQESFDELELRTFEKKQKEGYILSFEVMQEAADDK